MGGRRWDGELAVGEVADAHVDAEDAMRWVVTDFAGGRAFTGVEFREGEGVEETRREGGFCARGGEPGGCEEGFELGGFEGGEPREGWGRGHAFSERGSLGVEVGSV